MISAVLVLLALVTASNARRTPPVRRAANTWERQRSPLFASNPTPTEVAPGLVSLGGLAIPRIAQDLSGTTVNPNTPCVCVIIYISARNPRVVQYHTCMKVNSV